VGGQGGTKTGETCPARAWGDGDFSERGKKKKKKKATGRQTRKERKPGLRKSRRAHHQEKGGEGIYIRGGNGRVAGWKAGRMSQGRKKNVRNREGKKTCMRPIPNRPSKGEKKAYWTPTYLPKKKKEGLMNRPRAKTLRGEEEGDWDGRVKRGSGSIAKRNIEKKKKRRGSATNKWGVIILREKKKVDKKTSRGDASVTLQKKKDRGGYGKRTALAGRSGQGLCLREGKRMSEKDLLTPRLSGSTSGEPGRGSRTRKTPPKLGWLAKKKKGYAMKKETWDGSSAPEGRSHDKNAKKNAQNLGPIKGDKRGISWGEEETAVGHSGLREKGKGKSG